MFEMFIFSFIIYISFFDIVNAFTMDKGNGNKIIYLFQIIHSNYTLYLSLNSTTLKKH